MKIEEIPEYSSYNYKQECECGKVHIVLTQRPDFPEYETEVYILCDCGKYIEFILPVN